MAKPPTEPRTPAQQKRILRALDTNQLYCGPCNIRFHHLTDLAIDRLEDGDNASPMWKGARLSLCRNAMPECEGMRTALQVLHGKREGKRRFDELLAHQHDISAPDEARRDLSKNFVRALAGAQQKAQASARDQVQEHRVLIDELGSLWKETEQELREQEGGLPVVAILYVHMLEIEMMKRHSVKNAREITGRAVSAREIGAIIEALDEVVKQDADYIEEHGRPPPPGETPDGEGAL